MRAAERRLPPPAQAPTNNLQQQIDDLKGKVNALQSQVNDLKNNVSTLEDNVLPSLVQSVNVLTSRINEIGRESNGRYLPNILGNMERDPAYRSDIRRAVQGKVLIQNTLGYEPVLYINGTAYRAVGRKLRLGAGWLCRGPSGKRAEQAMERLEICGRRAATLDPHRLLAPGTLPAPRPKARTVFQTTRPTAIHGGAFSFLNPIRARRDPEACKLKAFFAGYRRGA